MRRIQLCVFCWLLSHGNSKHYKGASDPGGNPESRQGRMPCAVHVMWKRRTMMTMSAAALATSVPAMPMARPTSDSFRAGASLVPSPAVTTPCVPYIATACVPCLATPCGPYIATACVPYLATPCVLYVATAYVPYVEKRRGYTFQREFDKEFGKILGCPTASCTGGLLRVCAWACRQCICAPQECSQAECLQYVL